MGFEHCCKDADLFDSLYEMAVMTRDGRIRIEFPVSPKAEWDGTTALWDRELFRDSIRRAISEAS